MAGWDGGGRYQFRHTLYQQVVYERVPAGRRMQLHRRIGMQEEGGYGEQAGEHAAELATHFEQGRECGRAVRYRRQAAENALRRSAYREAIDHLSRGLAMLSRLPDALERARQELDLQLALGQTLTVTQGPGAPTVQSTYARAEELSREIGDMPQRVAILRGLRRMYQGRGKPRAAYPLAEEFLSLAEQTQDLTLLGSIHGVGGCLVLSRRSGCCPRAFGAEPEPLRLPAATGACVPIWTGPWRAQSDI